MKRPTILLIIITLSIIATGCTSVGRAKARRIDAETHRANELHNLFVNEQNDLLPVKVESKTNVIRAVSIIVVISSAGLAGAWLWWIFGWVQADLKRRQLAASVIPLDPVTRQYGLIYRELPNRKVVIYNPNNNGVIFLDREQAAVLQLADRAGVTQVAGLLPDHSALSKIIDG